MLDVQCSAQAVPERATFACGVSNPLASVTCSVDGGQPENCTLPVELTIDKLGTGNHTLVVIIVDVFGQTSIQQFDFALFEPPTPTPTPPPGKEYTH